MQLNREKLVCPHCQGSKVVKNGQKRNGAQVYRCKNCKKCYQNAYKYRGSDPNIRLMARDMLINCAGIREVSRVLHICTSCVLHLLLSFKDLCWIPKHRHYHQVEVDEVYSFVKSKKKKVWILYAYCKNSREILAVTLGKRNRQTVRELYKRLKDIQVDYWCSDKWEAFKEVFPKAKHLIGKKFTKTIEGVNTWLRSACKRLVRRTTAFSKKVLNHWIAIKLAMYHRNFRLSII